MKRAVISLSLFNLHTCLHRIELKITSSSTSLVAITQHEHELIPTPTVAPGQQRSVLRVPYRIPRFKQRAELPLGWGALHQRWDGELNQYNSIIGTGGYSD